MTDKSGGWLSSVGRLFKGATETDNLESSVNVSPKSTSPKYTNASNFLKDVITVDNEGSLSPINATGKNVGIRYLSPSVLDAAVSSNLSRHPAAKELNTSKPVSDIFSSPIVNTTRRKRLLTETESSGITFGQQDFVKRARSVANRSFLDTTSIRPVTNSTKLDTTWSGAFSLSHSPASSITNRSLLSRRSAAPSNNSELSSSTLRLLSHLDQIKTPARDVQRLPMLRTALRPESWAPTTVKKFTLSSDAPPLRKAQDSVPSRIQLLSNTMGISAQRKPYWRDLTRKRSDAKSKEVSVITLSPDASKPLKNGSSDNSILHPLFAVEKPHKESSEEVTKVKKHVPVVKGSDGKTVSRNTFKAADIVDTVDDFASVEDNWMTKATPLLLPADSEVTKGFLNDVTFSFGAPKEVTYSTFKKSSQVLKDDTSSDEKNSVESSDESSSDSEDEETKSASSSDESVETKDKEKKKADESRPLTSTDTVSLAATPQSSTNNSPNNGGAVAIKQIVTGPAKTAEKDDSDKPWSCDGCFTSWPASQMECGCCGTRKGGSDSAPAAPKTLVSNLSTFASSKPASSITFGFGATTPATSSTFPSISKKDSSTPDLDSTKKVAGFSIPSVYEKKVEQVKAAPPISFGVTTSAKTSGSDAVEEKRVDWNCPDCMVDNKATDDKCVCCGHVKYKSATTTNTASVFGDRAFKPSAPPAGISFGLGSTSTSAKEPPKFAFGIQSSTTVDKNEVAPKSIFSFGQSSGVKPVEAIVTSAANTVKFATEVSSAIISDQTKSKETLAPSLDSKPKMTEFGSGMAFGSLAPTASSIPTSTTNNLTSKTDSSNTGPLFGSSSTSVFGSGKSLFGAVNSVPESAPSDSMKLNFGAVPATVTSASSVNTTGEPLFGSKPTTTVPAFGGFSASAAVSTAAPSIFSASATNGGSLFGGTSKPVDVLNSGAQATTVPAPLFGANKPLFSVGAEKTDNKAPLFGSMNGSATQIGMEDNGSSSKRSFFAAADSTTSTSVSGPKPFAFGNFAPAAPITTTSLTVPTSAPFGNNPLFGSTTTGSTAFGASNSTPSFGSAFANNASAVPPIPQPQLSSSSSTNSLFGQTEPPKAFQFGPTSLASTPFQFGSANAGANSAPFVFGSSQGSTGSQSDFQFGGAPAAFGQQQQPMGGAFSYQPSSNPGGAPGRKMVTARRKYGLKK